MSGSIADALFARAAAQPDAVAMHYPTGRDRAGRTRFASLSYAELAARVTHSARALAAHGIRDGHKACVMVPPGPDFFVLMFALFRAGAVPVLIDPGIDRRALRQCLAEAQPKSFIAIGLAHWARLVLGWARASVQQTIVVGRGYSWANLSLAELERQGAHLPEPDWQVSPEQLAAVLFTSGSTGVPKGVEYTHRMFAAQVALLQQSLHLPAGAVNLPTFPPFALFDPALGLTSVIPDMDPRRPGQVDPVRLLDTIARFNVQVMFGSPALLKRVAEHAQKHQIRIPGLQRILSAGAPVPPALVESALRMLPESAQVHTPYGATEALPVAVVEARELLGDARRRSESGEGICVGRPVLGNDVRVIQISDEAIADWRDDLTLAPGAIGEITVSGPSVTERYHARDAATKLAKIRMPDGQIRHRMGDLGFFAADGKLWYVGRKSQRVVGAGRTWYTECVEQIALSHKGVARAGLVGIGACGQQRPVLCVELSCEAPPWPELSQSLLSLLARFEASSGVRTLLPHPRLPVDIRHNAKIGRELLASWAGKRLKQ